MHPAIQQDIIRTRGIYETWGEQAHRVFSKACLRDEALGTNGTMAQTVVGVGWSGVARLEEVHLSIPIPFQILHARRKSKKKGKKDEEIPQRGERAREM